MVLKGRFGILDAFEACIRNGRLKPFEATSEGLAKEMTTALDELKKAHVLYRDGRYEDTVVQAYFSMYRSAKSLLLAGGYRDTNLYSLVAGVRRLYAQPGALDERLLELLKEAKDLKDLVHEGARAGKKEARRLLEGASRLMARACELLSLPGMAPPEELLEGLSS
jgi:uncharacterized protein (UPF0332 family)